MRTGRVRGALKEVLMTPPLPGRIATAADSIRPTLLAASHPAP